MDAVAAPRKGRRRKLVKSARQRRIELFHASTENIRPYPTIRFVQLCQQLRCTLGELAATFQIPSEKLSEWLRKGTLPPYVALHFRQLERAYICAKFRQTPHARKLMRGAPIVPVAELLTADSHD